MLICSHDLRRLPCSACSADQRNTRQHLDISQHLGKAGLTRKHRAFLQLARLRGPSPTTQGSAVRTRHRPRAKVRVTLRFRARWSFYRQSLVPPNPTEIPQTCTEESLRACVSCLQGHASVSRTYDEFRPGEAIGRAQGLWLALPPARLQPKASVVTLARLGRGEEMNKKKLTALSFRRSVRAVPSRTRPL
jgi:hypothetical protein